MGLLFKYNNMNSKHPSGLPYLFFTEMWERFGYYLMIGIFTLYLKDVKDGFGFNEAEAADLYGTFIAFVFLTPFIGGLLADRVLGYRNSIIIGGLLMGAGYCLMSIHSVNMLYVSMLLVIIGNGFFKPNISTLLGNLYSEPKYKIRKDDGYNIFYMGINIGAFICNFFGAALYNMLGWGAAFIAAGIGMFIGIIIFIIGTRHYKHVDTIKPMQPEDMSLNKIFLLILLPAFVFGIIGWLIPGNLVGSDSTDAFLFGCLPIVYFYFNLWRTASVQDKKPIAAMLAIFAVVIAFWAVFKQNGSTLNTWADRYTNREIPTTIQPLCSTLKLASEIKVVQDSFPLYDKQFRITKVDGKVVKTFSYPSYLQNLPKEKWPPEGGKIYVYSTNLFQSVNPAWVVFLTPLIVAFFTFLRSRKREPSTPAKIAWGLVISSLSTLVMVGAVYSCHNGATKASPFWFVGTFFVITIGELFLSPMGLSLVSKLSPPRITALMMGGWFLSTSIGNKLSGVLATLWDNYEDKANFFYVDCLFLAIAACLIFLMLKWLNAIFKEYGA
jgi:POT family proton-dependent oligopeptide transporter